MQDLPEKEGCSTGFFGENNPKSEHDFLTAEPPRSIVLAAKTVLHLYAAAPSPVLSTNIAQTNAF